MKNAIQSVIKANGNNEITGPILQAELLSMITTLGAGYQYMGVAQPSTNPGTPDARVMYLAYLPGTYVNFGGLTVTGFCVLKYDTVWAKEDIPISCGGGGADFLTEPDDLTLETVGNTQVLKFANRAYNNNTPNGLGYKILRGDLTFAEQITEANTVYEIRYDFDLNNSTVNVPSGAILKFCGGSISNGTLSGDINIISGKEKIFDTITITGDLKNPLFVEWFGAKGDAVNDDSAAFNAMFNSYIKTKNTVSYEDNSALVTYVANSERGYYIGSGITISNLNCKFVCSYLIYGGTGVALTLNEIWASFIEIQSIYHKGTTHWVNQNLIAINAINIQRCKINIGVIDHFRRGIVISATAGGAVYSNYFNLIAFFYTMQCFTVNTSGSGWNNHNYVRGGISDYFTGELEDGSVPRYLFGFDITGNYTSNAWFFTDNGIEGGETGHNSLKSYYLYFYSGSRVVDCCFQNARIEAINSNCNILLNDADVRNTKFESFLYARPFVKKTENGDRLYLINGVYRGNLKIGADNIGNTISLDYFRDYSNLMRGSRSNGMVPKSPYQGQVTKATDGLFTPSAGFYMAVYHCRGCKLLIRKTKNGRVGIVPFKTDGTGFSTKEEITGLSYFPASNSTVDAWFSQYISNPTYYFMLADNGDGLWSEYLEISENSNVEYIGVQVGVGAGCEILNIDASKDLIPLCSRDFFKITSTGIWNVHSNIELGERVMANNSVFLRCIRSGVLSSLASYINGISVTLTAGSNIMVCASGANYLWVGFYGFIDGQRFMVRSISGNNVTMDIVAKQNFTGNLSVQEAQFVYEFCSLTADEIAALPYDQRFIKGGVIYDLTNNLLKSLINGAWQSMQIVQ